MGIRRAKFALPGHLPAFLALTDPVRTPDPVGLARALPAHSGLIYRHFGAEDRYEIARALAQIANRRSLALLIGNDPELARAVRADGVHWAETNREDARRWRNRFSLMTCAAHSRAALGRVSLALCDAALFSTVFASSSPSASSPMGGLHFRKMVRCANVPVYGLGGVTADTIGQITHVGGAAAIDGAQVFMK